MLNFERNTKYAVFSTRMLGVILVLWILVTAILLEVTKSYAEKSNSEMVYFPSGEFWMGSPEGVGQPDEHPRHKVHLDAFYLDRFEVTGADFMEFLTDQPDEHPTITGWWGRQVRPGMENHPVIGLTWKRCQKFCRWNGKRLPTEAEWERAAAGLAGRLYPWGNEPPTQERANFYKCCFIMKGEILQKKGSFESGKTPEGVYDMAGNIAEWVFDWYDKNYYKVAEQKNPRGTEDGKYHVIRGGAWNSLPNNLRSSDRYGYNDGKDYYGIGCRCAKSALP
ncbi:MAG: formylglycine-generating enzyme family protein [Nitrospinales bacterium]